MENRLYYDLTKKEIKEYKHEFCKTPGGNEINTLKFCLDFASILFFIGLFCDLLMDVVTDSFVLSAILIILEVLSHVWFEFNFSSWLKNKHNIKRW